MLIVCQWSKNLTFFVQTNWVYQADVWRFCKSDPDSRLESFCKNVTRVAKNRDSNRVNDSSHATTANWAAWFESEVIGVIFLLLLLFQKSGSSSCSRPHWKFTLWLLFSVYTPKTLRWCLFCLIRKKHCCSYFAFSHTWLVEVVTWEVR